MKNLKYILTFLSLTLLLSSCEEENFEFGDIITPKNLQIVADIVGVDTDHPNGDGTGVVNLTVTSDNAISYKFTHNGDSKMVPNGKKTYVFGTTGLHTYTVTVVAIGTGGASSSVTKEIEVEVVYQAPAELLTMLTSDTSRVWRIKNEEQGHMGVGPIDAVTPIWWQAGSNEKAGTAMYDDRYTFNADGTITHTTEGFIFGKSDPLTADFGDKDQTPNGNKEFIKYPFDDYTANWELSAPGDQETLTLSNKGFIGFYVGGGHDYQIMSRTENEMHLKTIDATGTRAWFFILVAE